MPLGNKVVRIRTVVLAAVFAFVIVPSSVAQGQTYSEKVLHSFTGGADEAYPKAGLVRDAAGNLYGTTWAGSVFKVDTSGTETVLYTFTGGSDGVGPIGGLVLDAAGNLYGTTELGGTYNCGTVYEVSAAGVEKLLYSFTCGSDGEFPVGSLVRDEAGNLYSTTLGSGSTTGCMSPDCGTVFELLVSGGEKTLYTFTGGIDGAFPAAGLVRDAAGNLYGTTNEGGDLSCILFEGGPGCGTVFEVTVSGQETVLYSFTGGSDGAYPFGPLVLDAAGNLYGTTFVGGGSSGCDGYGCGTVFEVPVGGREKVLYSFTGASDGAEPSSGLALDLAGNLYGIAYSGGDLSCGTGFGCGTVFEIPAGGGEKVLYTFTGGADGSLPLDYSGLVRDAAGNLYGTTQEGGDLSCGAPYGCGTVFELTPTWQALTHQPTFSASTALLLTDGSVMVQDYGAADWWRLTPDNTGGYVNGTWSKLASFPKGYAPLYYASAVLPDGKVIVEGGEYNFLRMPAQEVNLGALYDPLHNTWTSVNPPNGGAGDWKQIGDAQSVVLSNGTFMLGNCCSKQQALFNEAKLTWTLTGKGKSDSDSEEGWTLLPDKDVLTVDTENGTESELYNQAGKTWSLAGSTIASLTNLCMEGTVPEIGPAVLQPDGTVFAIGGNGETAIYNSATGLWSLGPATLVFAGLGVPDGPASLLPSGNVLLQASPSTPCYTPPSTFYEFDGSSLTPLVAAPPNAPNDASYVGRMLLLPTGQVLFTDGSKDVELYTPGETWNTTWAPTITSVPATLVHGQPYTITGTQFNGLSQGAMYGDDAQSATNYPLVQIINQVSGDVFYARTHNHSTMGVATGSTVVSTHFDMPPKICSAGQTTGCIEAGESTLVVIANGIPSATVAVTVQ